MLGMRLMISKTTLRSRCSKVVVFGEGPVRWASMDEKAGNNADSINGNSVVWTISIPSRSSVAAINASFKSGPNRRFRTGSQFILPDMGIVPVVPPPMILLLLLLLSPPISNCP